MFVVCDQAIMNYINYNVLFLPFEQTPGKHTLFANAKRKWFMKQHDIASFNYVQHMLHRETQFHSCFPQNDKSPRWGLVNKVGIY